MKTTERLGELRDLDGDELGVRLKQARRELYELRFKLAVGQLENNREIRKVRKDIARILTVIHQNRMDEGAVAIAEAPGQDELAGVEADVVSEQASKQESEQESKKDSEE